MKTATLSYYRMSKDDQEGSIPQQESWAHDCCARDNLDLVAEYRDPGISGSEVDLRPGLKALLAHADKLFRSGTPATRLLVWKANRLSRADSCDTHALVIRPLRQAGVTHVQTQDGHLIDLYSRRDLLLFNVEQDAYAAEYLSSLASDVLRGKADIARQGFFNGGPIPLGYRLERTGEPSGRRKLSRLILGPPEEQELVRWIFRTYYETETSCALLARDLNKRKVKPSKASTWSPNCIAVILKNRSYLGESRWNDTHVGKFARFKEGQVKAGHPQQREEAKRRRGLKRLPLERNAARDAIMVKDAHPPIIAAALFEAVQAKLAAQAGRTAIREDRFYELADLVVCGHCEANCWCIPNPRGGRPTVTRIQCSRRRKDGQSACPLSGTEHHTEVLRRVATILQRDLGGPQAQAKIRAALKRRIGETRDRVATELEVLGSEIRSLEARRLTEARRLLELPLSVLESATAAHEETLRSLEQARARSATLLSEETSSPLSIDLAERSLALIQELPQMIEQIASLQREIEAGRSSVPADDLLAIRRTVRNGMFALIACVRVFWVPVTSAERKGKGRGHRHSLLEDVQLTLHPHVQEALLNVSANRTTSRRDSSDVRIAAPIVLSFLHPFAA